MHSFPNFNAIYCSMSSFNCCFLTTYRFLRRQVRWSSTPISLRTFQFVVIHLGFPCGLAGKEFTCDAGDLGSIPGLRRLPGGGNGYLLQYSGLESSMDCIVHGATKSHTRLNDFHFHCLVYNRPLRQFTHIDSFNPHSNPEADTISIPLYRGVN